MALINPRNKYDFYVTQSPIHNLGLFSRKFFKKGTSLGIAIYHPLDGDFVITKLARYINHSKNNANVYLYKRKNIYYLIAKSDIYPNQEILANYDGKDVPSFIAKSEAGYKEL